MVHHFQHVLTPRVIGRIEGGLEVDGIFLEDAKDSPEAENSFEVPRTSTRSALVLRLIMLSRYLGIKITTKTSRSDVNLFRPTVTYYVALIKTMTLTVMNRGFILPSASKETLCSID